MSSRSAPCATAVALTFDDSFSGSAAGLLKNEPHRPASTRSRVAKSYLRRQWVRCSRGCMWMLAAGVKKTERYTRMPLPVREHAENETARVIDARGHCTRSSR